jgi:hypothetical protein
MNEFRLNSVAGTGAKAVTVLEPPFVEITLVIKKEGDIPNGAPEQACSADESITGISSESGSGGTTVIWDPADARNYEVQRNDGRIAAKDHCSRYPAIAASLGSEARSYPISAHGLGKRFKGTN